MDAASNGRSASFPGNVSTVSNLIGRAMIGFTSAAWLIEGIESRPGEQAEDEEAMAEWEMHTAIALDDE